MHGSTDDPAFGQDAVAVETRISAPSTSRATHSA